MKISIMKITAAVLAAAMSIAVLAACANTGSGQATGSGTAATEAAAGTQADSDSSNAPADSAADNQASVDTAADSELREVNVVLDWYPNAIHTFLYTAAERGYYAEEGIKINIQFPSNTNDALSLVAAGRAEFGMYYPHDLIQAVANQGIGIKSIGSIGLHPLDIVLALKEKNINSPSDLVGKKVGYSGTALSEAFIRSMIEYVGADPSDVELQDVGFDLMSSMTTGNVDATIGCMVNHEVPQLEEEGFELTYFTCPEYGVPDYYSEVMLTSDKLLDEEPELVAGFLRASKKGFDDFKADPYECLKIILENQNEENFPLSESVEKISCDTLIPVLEEDGRPFLSQDAAFWQQSIDWMAKQGLIDQSVDASEVMAEVEY